MIIEELQKIVLIKINKMKKSSNNGTWKVQPALTPPSINIDKNIITRLLKTNQRLKAFNLGNIISDEHGIKGNNILPNPPINIGIIIKNIINIPWKVILELYWINL